MRSKLKKFAAVILVILMGWALFVLVKNNRDLRQKVMAQALKANSLMFEIGQAKEDSNFVFQRLKDANSRLAQLEQKVREAPAGASSSAAPAGKIPRPRNDANENADAEANLPPAAGIRQDLHRPNTKNFLIVGQHARLADSILAAMVNEDANKLILLSIPRDLSLNGRKINEYLPLYGPEVLKEKVEEVTGLAIQNYAVMNFDAFVNVIDELGGIEVEVEKAIYDNAYPDGAGGYVVYSVEPGLQHMDGEEALKYARSRHSANDFDRAGRQQKIFEAVKDKIFSTGIVDNFSTAQRILSALFSSIETDAGISDAISLLQRCQKMTVVRNNVLSTSNFLYSTVNVRGQYILLPKSGDFAEIQIYIRELADS